MNTLSTKAQIILGREFTPVKLFLSVIRQIENSVNWRDELLSAPSHDEHGWSMYWVERINELSPETQLMALAIREGELIAIEGGHISIDCLTDSLALAIAGVKRTGNAFYFSPYNRELAGVCEYAPKSTPFKRSGVCKTDSRIRSNTGLIRRK